MAASFIARVIGTIERWSAAMGLATRRTGDQSVDHRMLAVVYVLAAAVALLKEVRAIFSFHGRRSDVPQG